MKTTRLARIALGTTLAVAGCAAPSEKFDSSASTLIGGGVVDASFMSGAVLVSFPATGGFCTGTFVTHQHILLAAHCLSGVPATIAYSNETQPGSGTQAAVQAVHIHPAYRMGERDSPTNYMDLAVIVLAEPALVNPIPLQRVGAPAEGSRVGVLGYGCQTYWRSPDAKVRKYGEAAVRRMTSEFIQIEAADGFALCAGDSGGPLVQNGAIVGIARYAWWGSDPYVDRSEYVNLAAAHDWLTRLAVLAPTAEYVALIRSAFPGGHWVSINEPFVGTMEESRYLIKTQGTNAVYACRVRNHAMISPDPGCEGQPMLGLLGYLDSAPAPDGTTAPLYRCLDQANFDHFFSTDPGCEGHTTEYGGNPLGYARPIASPPPPPPPPPMDFGGGA